jgi:streptogramin lyase
MSGTVLGGHAPIVGAHVYLLQPGTSGIGSAATSILGTGTTTSPGGYPLAADTADPNVPVGAEYVTSDSNGAFNLTGAYKCTVGQPVYIYTYGGAPSTAPLGTPATYSISQIVVTNLSGNPNHTAEYTLTVSPSELLYQGESVTISGLTGLFTAINGTQVVLGGASSPTSNTFSITAKDPNGSNQINAGTYTTAAFGTTGLVTATPAVNNSIVELATLGNCPSSGNFSTPGNGALSYVYLNEVSTVATAYTFQPFTSSANNSAWDIGSSGRTQGLLGIENAADTAAQLYNIQGRGQISIANDGEGHIANAATVAGNGVVPQATIDTLGNILAACVDSAQTVNNNGTITPSAQCSVLFTNATDNGLTTGTPPIDTATAAINIARYPAGNHASATGVNANFVTNIFAIPTGDVPYAPNLATAPNDFTLSISYSGGGIGVTGGQSPHAVSIDASGNIYTLNYTGSNLSIFSPLGVPLSSTGFNGNGLNGPASVAVDSSSTYVWIPNYPVGTLSRFTTAGAAAGNFAVGQLSLQDAEIDGSGNIWVTTNNANALVKLNSAGTVQNTTTNLTSPFGLSIQPGLAGNIWVADETQNETSVFTHTGAVYPGSPFTAGGIHQPTGTAIDATGNVWFANYNGTVSALTSTGTAVAGSPFATSNTNYSDGIAIDGASHVWVTNSFGQTLYALTDTGAVISPSTGYLANPATQADGIAIDPSGNIWYDSYSAAVLHEIVGAAAPTVTPLSYAVANSKLGTTP